MEDARIVGSPQMQNEKVLAIEEDPTKINDPKLPYRELVGSRQYLATCMRSDIANAVHTLGQCVSAYIKENFASGKRVLKYLRGICTHGLVYKCSTPIVRGPAQVVAYSDADHANCPMTWRSVTGYVIQVNRWSFVFKSKKQKIVTDDIYKSELIAASMCDEDLVWACKPLKELGVQQARATLLMDSKTATKVSSDADNYEGVKRFERRRVRSQI